METREKSGRNFDGGFDSLIYDGDLHEGEHPRGQPSMPTYNIIRSRYCRPATVSLVLLAAVLLIVDISLGVHYNTLKDTHLTPDDMENLNNELTKLQDTYSAAVKTMNSHKKQLDSEKSRQRPTNWEFEHQTRRRTDYEAKFVKMAKDVAALRYYLPMLKAGCTHCPPGWILMNSMCYYFPFSAVTGYKTWQNARDFCRMHGGDLAVIDSKDKENATVNLLRSKLDEKISLGFWIGLRDTHDEGNWKWLNGTVLVEGYWMDGEPNNANNEDCAEVYPRENFFKAWNDIACDDTKKWICEKAPTSMS